MSPQTVHFWGFDKSPLSGPQRGPPSCNTWIPSSWQPSKQITQMMLCELRLSSIVLSAFSATSPQKVFSASQAVFLGARSYMYPTAEGTAPQKGQQGFEDRQSWFNPEMSSWASAFSSVQLKLSRTLWGSWVQKTFCVPCFLITENRLHSASMTFLKFQRAGSVANQGRKEMQRRGRNSQVTIVQPWGKVLAPHQGIYPKISLNY